MAMTAALRRKMKRLHADTVREDGRLERHCEHGIGHTVGHVSPTKHVATWGRYIGVHGCDGCCKDWSRDYWIDGERASVKETISKMVTSCYGERSLQQRSVKKRVELETLETLEKLRHALIEIASLAVWDRNSSVSKAAETYAKIQQIVREVLR